MPWRSSPAGTSELWRDDVAEILLAPDGDRTRYYEISFNARGAMFDGAIRNPNVKRDDAWSVDPTWNCEGIRWRATRPGTVQRHRSAGSLVGGGGGDPVCGGGGAAAAGGGRLDGWGVPGG